MNLLDVPAGAIFLLSILGSFLASIIARKPQIDSLCQFPLLLPRVPWSILMSRLAPLFLMAGEHKGTIDYHIHSDYNDDATGTIKEYMSAAIKKGLTSIAITNHVWKTSSWIENFINAHARMRLLVGR